MVTVDLPAPIERTGDRSPIDLAQLSRALRDRVDGEVRFDAGTRGAYSTDGSNFRQVPLGVVIPRSTGAGVEALRARRADS